MSTRHSLENFLRPPWEWLVTATSGTAAAGCLAVPSVFGLTPEAALLPAAFFAGLAAARAQQGLKVWRYQRGLLKLKPCRMRTRDVPCSDKHLFIGYGFPWRPAHRQRLDLLSQPQYEKYRRKNAFYRTVQAMAQARLDSFWNTLTRLPFLKPQPPIGGKPWLHGTGAMEERPVYVLQSERNGHMLVLGKTRVGKTRLLSIMANQDIRNGEAVIIIDPKGDLALLQDIYAAAKVAGRLDDFFIVHAGCPEWSARYSPLQAYTDIAEVTERVTSGIDAEGEGKQFNTDFHKT